MGVIDATMDSPGSEIAMDYVSTADSRSCRWAAPGMMKISRISVRRRWLESPMVYRVGGEHRRPGHRRCCPLVPPHNGEGGFVRAGTNRFRSGFRSLEGVGQLGGRRENWPPLAATNEPAGPWETTDCRGVWKTDWVVIYAGSSPDANARGDRLNNGVRGIPF